MYLVSHCHVKKNCFEICNIFFNKYFRIFLFRCDCFFAYKKLEIYEDSYFSVFLRLNVAKCVIKRRKVEIITLSRNKPNTAKTKNTLFKVKN